MKLHLPLKLRAALLALCLSCAPSAFAFADTIFKFEDSLASETGGGLHQCANPSISGGTASYSDSGLVLGSYTSNYLYKLTSGYGKALTFDSSAYVRLGDAFWSNGVGKISPQTNFTLLTYAKFDSVSGSAAFFGTGESSVGFLFGMEDGKFKLSMKGKEGGDYVLSSMTALSTDTWYALAVSYDATAGVDGKGLATFYVDGISVGTLTIDNSDADFNNAGGAGASIGSGAKDTPDNRWSGAMAEFQILSGALDANQVRNAFHLARVFTWNNEAGTSKWNEADENWYDGSRLNSYGSYSGQWVIFNVIKQGTVAIDGTMEAAGMTVAGNYAYSVDTGKSLKVYNVLEIADTSVASFGGDGSVTIVGNVNAIGDQGTGKLKVEGTTMSVGGTITTALEVTGGTLTAGFISGNTEISGGSVTLTGGRNAFTGSDLRVSGGELEIQFTNSTKASCIAAGTNIRITGGGTLKLTGHDMLGWEEVSPAAINLEGTEADKIATLIINENTTSGSVMTLPSAIKMSGYAEMKGSAVNTHGTSFEASGENNTISNDILVRDLLTIDVDTAGELTIKSKLLDYKDSNGAVSSKKITKTGEGRVIFTNSTYVENTDKKWSNTLAVQEGIVQLKDGAKLGTATIDLAKGTTLEFSGTGDLMNAVTGSGTLSVLAGANYTVKSNMILGATIENAGTFALDGTHGGMLTFTSKDDLTRGEGVVYRDPIQSKTDMAATDHGYAEGTFIVINNVGENALVSGIDKIYIKGETDPYTDIVGDVNGVKIVGTKAMKGLYYVNDSLTTFKYGETKIDDTPANAAASPATTGVVLNGNRLIMLTDLAQNAANQDGIILVPAADAAAGNPTKTISVADGVTLDNVALNVQDGIALRMQRYNNETGGERNGEDIIMKQLTGDGTLVAGSGILVKKSGSFTGSYEGIGDDVFVRLGTASEDAIQELRADAKLMVIGTAGTVKLTGLTNTAVGASNVLGGIDSKGVSVNLGNLNVADDGTLTPTTVTLERKSFMDRGVLEFAVSIKEVNDNLYAPKADKPIVTNGAALNLNNVTLKIQEVNYMDVEYNAAGPETDILLFVLSDAQDSSATNISFDMSESKWLNKYFTNFRVEKGSINVVADANTGIYAAHGQTPNGIAGLGLAGKAMFRLNPQTKTPDSELAQVLNLLDDHNKAGNEAAMDRLGAALAGSSLPAVGMAVADDVQRQLRSIRNRTTTMGVNQCEVNEDMPYINGWISGDCSYSQLSASSTDSGYQVSSWGGTVGVDVDVNPNLTLGVSVSALFGDYTGKAEDVLKGDLDTQYVSLFARVSTGSWVNTFVGTLGRADVDLERTIPGIAGKTTYKTNGMMFGFLYEVARTFALNADATTCVQPLFNMSFSHTTLDSATEGGTADTRLTTDSASLTQFSLGLGGRLQSIVGENEYNRASILEARALLKLDFGDRYSKLNTALAALPTATVSTRSNEKGVIGAEVGATLTIPISQDAGSIFFDVNADFRADQTGVNGSIGYRVNF